MRRGALLDSAAVSLLAALTTWLTLSTWSGFSAAPGGYLRPLALACLIVAAAGILLRAARLPALLVMAGQLAVLVVWLNHRLAPVESLGGWLPTGTSVGVALDALQASFEAAQSYASPVPASATEFPPMLILVGALVAVLVDLLACGLRRVPLSGLPLLAMYTAPVSLLPGGVAWWKFALVALSFLCLLAVEEGARLRHWGRDLGALGRGGTVIAPSGRPGGPVESRTRAEARTVALAPSASRIAFSALALALVVPAFVPTLSSGVVFGSGGLPGSGGGRGVTLNNPLVDMQRDLTRGEDLPLVTVRTSDPDPTYLRLAVLDSFDGNSWRPSRREIPIDNRAAGDVPSPMGLGATVTTQSQSYEVRVSDGFRTSWLPAPYPTISLAAPGDWRYDTSTMDFVSAIRDRTAAGISYSLTSLSVLATPEQLAEAGASPPELFRRFTVVERDVPDWIGDLAQQVTDGHPSRFEKAVALQNWFRLPHDSAHDPDFTYSLVRAPRGNGVDDLTEFLRGSRVGYCEQFAAAMALMARELGIPSRVAVGFLRPESFGANRWVYSAHDLHAWPELYFHGVGWTRFEPTPASREGAEAPGYTTQPVAVPDAAPTPSTAGPTPTPTAPTRTPRLPEEELLPTPSADGSGGGPSWPVVGLGVVLVGLALSGVPRLLRSVERRRRWGAARTPAELAEAGWRELRASTLDLGLPWDDRVTVRQRARQLRTSFCRRPGPGEEELARTIRNNPAAEASLDRLVTLVERARYAPRLPAHAALAEQVRTDVSRCVEALRIGRDPRQRRHASWFPRSLWVGGPERGPRRGRPVAQLDEPAEQLG